MKTKIHPKYYPEAKISCACGNTFTTGSTLPEINVDICAACHPFFTGEMKLIDTQGRIERFQTKQKQAAKYAKKTKKKAKSRKQKEQPKSLKEMLQKGSKEKKKPQKSKS